ncbi:MAG: hypothetical protein EBR30_04575 [Cytophagia bacterium]|nr:hypothetical protein [Cytophagia bacterium]NBW34288.1 hypothetical protein [Cytophagia bacterium]
MKNILFWSLMAVLFSSFECAERCHESEPPPYVEGYFVFEDANNVNLLTSNQLTLSSIEIRNTDSGELLNFAAYDKGILIQFIEGEQNFILTTPLKDFEFSVEVESFQGECSTVYQMNTFSIDGRNILFTQPVFTFRF